MLAVNQANTAAASSIAIEAGPVKTTRIRQICVMHTGVQTTASFRTLTIKRTTTAGSGGVVTPTPADPADTPFSGVVRSNGTDGTAGVTLMAIPIWVPAAGANMPLVIMWPPGTSATEIDKDLTIPPGIGNGIAIDDSGAVGASGLSIALVFTEE